MALFSKTFLPLALALAGLLAACTPGEDGRGDALLANQPGGLRSTDATYANFEAALNGRSGDRRSIGSNEFLGSSRTRLPPISAEGGGYTLNLLGVPIDQAAKAVLGDALGHNYTISPDVRGTVTLQTSRPLSGADLIETFQSILELNGATLQASGGGGLAIVPLAGAASRVQRAGEPAGIGSRIVALPLEYIGTTEMMRLLESIAGPSVRLQPVPNRNVLLIAGTRDEINAAIDAVNLFDVDVLAGKSVALVKLRAAEPEAVVAEINAIFETGEGGSLQNVVTFVPSQRLGAVIVISSRSDYLPRAERWIRDLDSAAGGTRRRPVVYGLQNRSAADLAPILSELIQQVASEETATVAGSARVVADDARNAVIVWGNDREQEAFAMLIQSLDTAPVQVLLEATIAEVSLNDELNFGLRWFFENGQLSGTFSDAASGSIGPNFPGLSFLFQGNSARAALNALNSVTDVNVVSSPSILVLDNQEAKLQIGDQVPIATQQVRDTSDPDAPVVNTISFRDTGIILVVKPRVSRGGQVILDIEQEVSSVSNTTTSGIDSPTISQRRIETSVVVQDGQTLALGGLIQENRNQTNAQVPGLGDAPVVGGLFRNRRDEIGRTELLILITPRVIRTGGDMTAITAELRRRLQEANGLVQTGINDPGIGHRIVD